MRCRRWSWICCLVCSLCVVAQVDTERAAQRLPQRVAPLVAHYRAHVRLEPSPPPRRRSASSLDGSRVVKTRASGWRRRRRAEGQWGGPQRSRAHTSSMASTSPDARRPMPPAGAGADAPYTSAAALPNGCSCSSSRNSASVVPSRCVANHTQSVTSAAAFHAASANGGRSSLCAAPRETTEVQQRRSRQVRSSLEHNVSLSPTRQRKSRQSSRVEWI